MILGTEALINSLIIISWIIASIIGLLILKAIIGIQYISNDNVGVVEKLWGKSIAAGRIIATEGEAGLQSDPLRGGIHFGLPRWRYRLHRVPLVSIASGKIGYVYARDGLSVESGQILARTVNSDNFQNARLFLKESGGQRGRQRAILREGVYAINLAQFTIITQDRVYSLNTDRDEMAMVTTWQMELQAADAFNPVVIGGTEDQIGIVTVQDGLALPSGEIIAPEVSNHNNFQDAERFIGENGYRGKQYMPLLEGTYFVNRWFATVEKLAKTVIPMGYVGVVISYYGKTGKDNSGAGFRHGERVTKGERGVWSEPLGPGKYAFNTYAGQIIVVPTTNFVLHWINGRTESHRYDANLKSIDLVTMDAYEPVLPLSLVVHIDYQKAPGVVQRFGDVGKLINQTIDPMLSAYFRDVCHKQSMLGLLQKRDEIQREAKATLEARFAEFDIEVVDVLIGKPESGENDNGKIEILLEQLRQRQLSKEQVETFEQQRIAAEKRKSLEEAQAIANKQNELTNSSVQISIVENEANAQLAKSKMQAQQTIVMADAQLEQSKRVAATQIIKAKADAEQAILAANAQSESQILIGKGEGTKVLQVGIAEATALQQKVRSYGDPRLYALVMASESIRQSNQPLVPQKMFITGGGGDSKQGSGNVLNTILELLLAENTTFANDIPEENTAMADMAKTMVNKAVAVLTTESTKINKVSEPPVK